MAAIDDDRFESISKMELPYLSVSVSLLNNFERRVDKKDWQPGKHGV